MITAAIHLLLTPCQDVTAAHRYSMLCFLSDLLHHTFALLCHCYCMCYFIARARIGFKDFAVHMIGILSPVCHAAYFAADPQLRALIEDVSADMRSWLALIAAGAWAVGSA